MKRPEAEALRRPDRDLVAALAAIVGPDRVAADPGERTAHALDAARRRFPPDVVVHPETTEEVARILRLASERRVPVVPRGAGSGFSGGAVAVRGGILLVLTRMNRILEIDEENLTAAVQPGLVTARFQEAVEARGLFYPPDPASLAFSTLGGNVAECAGGPRCVKYGVTRDYVLGLTAVTPGGDIIRTGGRVMKNVVGYDLTRLFTGSEGTLGVITEIVFRLLPKPAAKRAMLAAFREIEGAAAAVSAIIRERIIPTTLEFMDEAAVACVADAPGLDLPTDCGALLLIEVDGEADRLGPQLERIVEVIRPLGLAEARIAANEAEAEALRRARRGLGTSLRKLGPDRLNEDIVVPRSKLPEMIRRLADIGRRLDLAIVNFGHAGDGNIHVNVICDLARPGVKERADEALDAIFRAAADLGGVISGEHGIGIAKLPWVGLNLDGPTLAVMRAVKQALDPLGIMNPGKMFPDIGPGSARESGPA